MRTAIGLLILAAVPGLAAETGSSLPLFFFRNTGQTNPGIRFISETPRFRVGFQTDSVIFQVREQAIRLRFAGSQAAAVEGIEPMTGRANFLTGNRDAEWRSGVATFHK